MTKKHKMLQILAWYAKYEVVYFEATLIHWKIDKRHPIWLIFIYALAFGYKPFLHTSWEQQGLATQDCTHITSYLYQNIGHWILQVTRSPLAISFN